MIEIILMLSRLLAFTKPVFLIFLVARVINASFDLPCHTTWDLGEIGKFLTCGDDKR